MLAVRMSVRGTALRLARPVVVSRRTVAGSAVRPTATAAAAAAPGGEKLAAPGHGAASPKIGEIVNAISQLTLLETADLVAQIKARFNIGDVPVFSGAGPAASGAAPAAAPAAEAKPAVVEKTEFKVKLEAFDAANKVALIRAVKDIVKDLNLIAAKKFVEESPKVLKEAATKDEAAKIKADLEKLGAKVSIE